jgi:hypothetical protein
MQDASTLWGRPVDYSACEASNNPEPTTAHRDHVHIELNWAGARKRTSFWGSPAAG